MWAHTRWLSLAAKPADAGGGFLPNFINDPAGTLAGLRDGALEWITGPGLFISVAVSTTTTIVLTAGLVARRLWRKRQNPNARLLIVRPAVDVDEVGAQVLWRTLTGLLSPRHKRFLLGQSHLCFEYQANVDGLRLAVWVPGTIPPGLVEHAIAAAWPGSQITEEPVIPPLSESGRTTAGGVMRLVAPEHFPLATRHNSDPLRPLLQALAHLREGEAACVQIAARPATGRRLRVFRRGARRLRHGTTGRALPGLGLLDEALGLFLPGAPARTHHRLMPAASVDPFVAEEIGKIREKATHPQWEVAILYGITTSQTGKAAGARVRGVADAIATALAVHAGRNALRRRQLRHPARVLAGRGLRRGFLLSVPELAALAHVPYEEDSPGLQRAAARTAAPRRVVPATGKVLGQADAGPARTVAMAVADGRHHVQVIGANGTGKSTLLANMICSDVDAGRGVLVIDPKGDLITDLLGRIPQSAARRVVLFDPDDRGPWPVLNVLAGPDRHAVVDNLVGIFRRIYAEFWGPRTDDIMRAACLTLSLTPGATLADVPDLLTDAATRTRFTAGISDAVLRGFWTWYANQSEANRAQVIAPLLNKLRSLLLRPFARHTLCATTSTVDLTQVLDGGGICLVRIPKGSLGTDTSSLIGSLILAKAWEAATARARRRESSRNDAVIYLDEAQNFLTLPQGVQDMLAEARAYRVSFVLAHQDLAQFPSALREGVSTNARNKIIFAVSPEDAHTLRRHVAPLLTEHDLVHLDAFHAAARLVVNHAPVPAFTFRTTPLAPRIQGRERQVRQESRSRHGSPATSDPGRKASRVDPRRTTGGGVPPQNSAA